MDTKIDIAIEYSDYKELIRYGEEMAVIEYKLTALEIAKEN